MVSGGRGWAAAGGGAGTAGATLPGAGAGDAVGGGTAVPGAGAGGAGWATGAGMVVGGCVAGAVTPGVGAMVPAGAGAVAAGAVGAGAVVVEAGAGMAGAGAGVASTTGAWAWLAAGTRASSATTPALSAITRRLTRVRRASRASTCFSDWVGANGGRCGIVASLANFRIHMPGGPRVDHSGCLLFHARAQAGAAMPGLVLHRRQRTARRRRASAVPATCADPMKNGAFLSGKRRCQPPAKRLKRLLTCGSPAGPGPRASAPRPPPGTRPAGTCRSPCSGSGP
ncbi:hypothetical protein MNJPNG_03915 [Cupriavidus oxalaticus]